MFREISSNATLARPPSIHQSFRTNENTKRRKPQTSITKNTLKYLAIMPPLSNSIHNDGSFNSLDGHVCNDKTTSSMTTSNKRSVSFKTIEVREYERVLGDHPSTKYGPPMSIGWAFVEHDAIALDEYEAQRKQKNGITVLLAQTRRSILRDDYNYSDKELHEAERDAARTFYQRCRTMNIGKFEEACEELREKAAKSIKKFGGNMKRKANISRVGSLRCRSNAEGHVHNSNS